MNKSEISIIVPIYNAEKYIKRCVDSILSQTFQNLQIILVDDGSNDATPQICDEYGMADNRITVVHTDNRGAAAARNTGLELSNGMYIGFIDADDYIEPDMYEIMYREIVSSDSDVCCCGYYVEEINDTYIKRSPENIIYNGSLEIFKASLRQDIETGVGSGNWNKLFKSEVINGIRYNDYVYAEDIDFQFNVFKKLSKMICISDIKYHYISNEYSATQNGFNEKYERVLDIVDNILKYVLEKQSENAEYAYAFHLTWYMAILQKIYELGNTGVLKDESKICINRIRNSIQNNLNFYKNNQYAKRLDKYYMYALILHVVPFAVIIRKYVIHLRKIVQ